MAASASPHAPNLGCLTQRPTPRTHRQHIVPRPKLRLPDSVGCLQQHIPDEGGGKLRGLRSKEWVCARGIALACQRCCTLKAGHG